MKRTTITSIRMLVIGALIVAWACTTFAAGTAVDYETMTTSDTSRGFTTSKIAKTSGAWANQAAASVLISVETASINFTLDGTTPTNAAGTNAGHRMDAGQSYLIRGITSVKQFRCISRVAATPATIKATFFYGGE